VNRRSGILPVFNRQTGWLFLFLLVIGCVLPVTAAEDITLRVWIMGGEAELISQLSDRFEKENPGVKVRIQAFSWGGCYEKLVTAFLGGAPPDVCQLGTTMMHDFYAMGALESLEPLFSDGRLSSDDFFPASIETCRYDGQHYGVPWYVDTRLVFYRREYLDRYGMRSFPATWQEFLEFGRRVVADKRAAGLQNSNFASMHGFTFEMFYWQAGGLFSPLSSDKPAFEEEPMLAALEYDRTMRREGFLGKPNDSGLDYITEFDNGVYEVVISGPWMASDLKKNAGRLKNAWDLAPLPAGKTRTSFIGGSNLVQFKDSRHKEAGQKLILFLSRPDIQAEWYRISSDLPASRPAMARPELAEDRVMQVFRQQLEDTRLPPPEKEWSIFWDRFYRQYDAFLESNDDAKAFVGLMNDTMAAIVREKEAAQAPATGNFYWLVLSVFPLLLVSIYVVNGFKSHSGQTVRQAVAASSLHKAAWFLGPALLILLIFRLLPLCIALAASFTDLGAASITDPARAKFIALSNFHQLYRDQIFWKSVRNTLTYLCVGVPANLLIALTLALVVNRFTGWKRNLLAMGFFLPSVVTTVASAVTWRWLYCQQSPLNDLVNWLGFGPINWLNDADLALPALIVFSIWRSYGLSMIILLAGLELINRDLYEAVRIDGGSYWHELRHVTLPGLRRTLFALVVGSVVANIQFFLEPYVLTGGGPKDETISLLLFSYQRAFGSFQLGYASSVIVVLFAFFLLFNLWQQSIRRKLS